MKRLLGALVAGFFLSAQSIANAGPGDLFIVHDLDRNADDVAADIRDYVDANEDWLFLSQFGLKGGEVLALKICYLPLGEHIFAAGMHVSAMMPCGHLAFYEEDGQPRLSMLDLRFMTELQADPNLERAVEIGAPAFAAMLAEVLE